MVSSLIARCTVTRSCAGSRRGGCVRPPHVRPATPATPDPSERSAALVVRYRCPARPRLQDKILGKQRFEAVEAFARRTKQAHGYPIRFRCIVVHQYTEFVCGHGAV